MTRKPVAVVTDSSAYLPPALVAQYGIHVIPLTLVMGAKTWLDGVEIDPPAFYQLLKTSSSFPTTSQPSVAQFEQLFTQLNQEADGIVAVLISEALSGTIASARGALVNLPDIPVEIVDSRGTSMMLGYTVLAAARAAAAGGDLATVAAAARQAVDKTGVYFVVETLEYLHRGGRIGTASKFLGSALNLKPILEIRDGVVQGVTKVRTRRKALDKVYELLEARLGEGDRVHLTVINVAAPEEARQFKAELESRFRPVEMLEAECSPAIGAHAGPGTVGVAFYSE